MSICMMGTDVAKAMKERLTLEVLALKEEGINPNLTIIRVGERPDDLSYERGATKRMEMLGIEYKTVTFSEDICQEKLEEEFQKINDDEKVHGILLLRPLPKHLKEDAFSKIINPLKDVDGMSPLNVAKVFMGDSSAFAPCTAEAVVKMLDYYKIDCDGKKAIILGRSMVIGRPLSMLLLKKNATVTICHTHTLQLEEECRKASILVVAVGKSKMVTSNMVGENAIVVDVGINVDESGNLCGDVDFNSVQEKTSYISPVPKGVGSVTTSVLAEHIIRSAKYLNNK